MQIIFHKRATKYSSLLQKMTYKDKGSYESSPPCTQKPSAVIFSTPHNCVYAYVVAMISRLLKIVRLFCRILSLLEGSFAKTICSHVFYTHITGWRRLIGSPKLQIIFHKRATKYRSLLRKMTYKDKGSYESSPPYNTQLVCRICVHSYVVATISRLLRIIRLFCRILSLLYGSFAKMTYNYKEPTNLSHFIHD